MLRVARALAAANTIRICTTLLAAHAVPPEFAGRGDAYLGHIIDAILPAAIAENLADAIDGFAESIAFSPAQIARLFTAATALNIPVKLHADQLTDGDGAALAASFNALSADHLEYTSEAGARAMAASGTVAVLLPGAYATVGATQPPPIAAFRAHGVRMARRHRLQSRQLPARVAAHGRQSRKLPVPPDAGRNAGRHHPQCGRGTGAVSRNRHAGGRKIRRSGAMGQFTIRANWPIGWAGSHPS